MPLEPHYRDFSGSQAKHAQPQYSFHPLFDYFHSLACLYSLRVFTISTTSFSLRPSPEQTRTSFCNHTKYTDILHLIFNAQPIAPNHVIFTISLCFPGFLFCFWLEPVILDGLDPSHSRCWWCLRHATRKHSYTELLQDRRS